MTYDPNIEKLPCKVFLYNSLQDLRPHARCCQLGVCGGGFLGSDLRPQGWDFGDETGLVGAGEKFFEAGPPSYTEIEG